MVHWTILPASRSRLTLRRLDLPDGRSGASGPMGQQPAAAAV